MPAGRFSGDTWLTDCSRVSIFCYYKPYATPIHALGGRRGRHGLDTLGCVNALNRLTPLTLGLTTLTPCALEGYCLRLYQYAVVYYANLPVRWRHSGSDNLPSVAPCRTCSTRATQSASTLCTGYVLSTPAMAILSIVVGLVQRRLSRSLEVETFPGRSSHDTEAASSQKLVCSRRTTLSCEAAVDNLSARTLGA